MIINKRNEKSSLYQERESSFNYKGIKNALIGRTGDNCFEVKSILVIQMK